MARPALLALSFLGAALVLSQSARALPPDARLVLAPGAEKFVRAGLPATQVVVEPESLASAELQPSNEIFLTAGQTAGTGVIVAVAADRLWVWELCVSSQPEKDCGETKIESAKAACPDLAQADDDGQKVWKATIATPACLAALRDALSHSTSVRAKSLRLVLDEGAAREFYKRVSDRIQSDPRTQGLTASYLGATLRLGGKASSRAVARALVHAYQETVGRVSYESTVTLTDSPPAAAGTGASR